MKNQDTNETDIKITTDTPDEAAPNAAEPSEVMRELTDEQFAAVVGGGGGGVGQHIGSAVERKH